MVIKKHKVGQTFDGVYFENIEILVAFPILVEIKRTYNPENKQERRKLIQNIKQE